MSKIDDLINKLCPNGVEFKDLEKCCNILDNKRKPVTKSARISGEFPYYGANGIQDYVSEYIFDGRFVLVGEDGSVINDRGNPIVTWAEGKIWVNNHAHIIEEIDGVLLRYLFHYIQTVNVTNLIHGNIPKLNQGDFRKIQIAVPPIEVQCEIVHILDDFTLLSAELSAELKARQQQYDYYKSKLFNDCITTNTEFKILNEIADVRDGTHDSPKPVQEGKYLVTSKNVKNGDINFNGSYFISIEDYNFINQRSKVDKGDLLFTMIGTIGEVGLVKDEPNYAIKNVGLIKTNNDLLSKFLFHYLTSNIVKEYIENNKSKGSQVFLALGKLRNIPIPILTEKEMEKVVRILDQFDKICNDLTEGLPAEIEARQKQYEYYRDKLLTFKELKVSEVQ